MISHESIKSQVIKLGSGNIVEEDLGNESNQDVDVEVNEIKIHDASRLVVQWNSHVLHTY